MSSQIVISTPRHERLLHPLPLRIMHWVNAVAIFIMIGSGSKIYNDDANDFRETFWSKQGFNWFAGI
jgi:Ni,Fe-hydrogenase I cytochrome b subunit